MPLQESALPLSHLNRGSLPPVGYSEPQNAFLRFFLIAQEVFFMSLITVSGLTFAYDGSYDNVFEDVSFQFDTS